MALACLELLREGAAEVDLTRLEELGLLLLGAVLRGDQDGGALLESRMALEPDVAACIGLQQVRKLHTIVLRDLGGGLVLFRAVHV